MPEIFGLKYREEPWGCWVQEDHDGKRKYCYKPVEGKSGPTHRRIWEKINGPAPCFNPDHLELGTNSQNLMDRKRKPCCDTPKSEYRQVTARLDDDLHHRVRVAAITSKMTLAQGLAKGAELFAEWARVRELEGKAQEGKDDAR